MICRPFLHNNAAMLFFLLIVFLSSFMLTWALRFYGLKREVLDIPNARSAHTMPTPRGGGIAFVLSVLMILPYIERAGFLTFNGSTALVMAGVFIASLGFFDDHGHLSSMWRLLGHTVAATLALYWVGGMPELQIGAFVFSKSTTLDLFGLFYLVWLTNLYNFMDGVNGLSSIEALSVCLGMTALYAHLGEPGLMVIPLVLAAGVLGFLGWNFPRARIFMGDAGSGFLGFIFGVLSIQAALVNPHLLWSWIILLGVFISDATYTILRRILRLEKIYQAHSMHGFQHAARRFGRHEPVTIGVLLINILWLFPIAWMVGVDSLDPLYGICIAYAPLVGLAFFFNAGRPS